MLDDIALADAAKRPCLCNAHGLDFARSYEFVVFQFKSAELIALCVNFRRLYQIKEAQNTNHQCHAEEQEEFSHAQAKWICCACA